MIKLPRSQSSSIKDMIYPEVKKTNKNFHVSNIKALKQRQIDNRLKKEEKENFVQAQPFKIKEFKKVESRLTHISGNKDSIGLQNNYATERKNQNEDKKLSKFKSGSLLKSSIKTPEKQKEENIFDLMNKDVEKRLIVHNLTDDTKNEKLKNSSNLKINNFSEKPKVVQTEETARVLKREEVELPVHRNYGKTPEYLKKYKEEAQEKKLNEKRQEDQAKYPKGTRLLSEDERVETLSGLVASRKEIINVLEKFPISMRTMSIQNRKTELESKLNEIETAIKTFTRKQVFIKID